MLGWLKTIPVGEEVPVADSEPLSVAVGSELSEDESSVWPGRVGEEIEAWVGAARVAVAVR